MIYLRACDEFDAVALAELRAAGLIELGLLPAVDAAGFTVKATREIGRLFRGDRIAAWIACDGERAVGSSCAVFYDRLPYPDGSRHAEICGVYVRPAYRRRGFAAEFVREVVGAARGSGARKTYLRPSPTARALYTKLGFVETDLMTFDVARADALGGVDARKFGPASEPALAAWPNC